MPTERKFDARNIKRVALAAPILFAAAHFGCNTPNQKEPPPSPSQTSGQQDSPKTTQLNQPNNSEMSASLSNHNQMI